MSFTIANVAFDIEKLKKDFTSDRAGAFVAFEGRVRNHNDGKKVTSLEYEVYDELALNEGNLILEAAKTKFNVIDIKAVHRSGQLLVKETAVWIGVLAAHREQAYLANQYMIDELKKRLPIWKKEFYEQGPSEWIACHGCSDKHTEVEYYEKQSRLVGALGQEKLKKARVLIVGVGGLGSPVADYLARAGVGNLTLCDKDKVEVSNLHRQTLFNLQDINKSKAEVAKQKLAIINPFINVQSICEEVNESNVEELLANQDIVVDCSDNFKAKFLLNDAAFFLNKKLIGASIYAGDGQIQVYDNFDNGCLRCLWEEIPANDLTSCTDAGILGAQTGSVGSLQALQVFKLILKNPEDNLNNDFYINLDNLEVVKLKRFTKASCLLCSEKPAITSWRQLKQNVVSPLVVLKRELSRPISA